MGSRLYDYKRDVERYLWNILGWSRQDAINWVDSNFTFIKGMMTRGQSAVTTAQKINRMKKGGNAL